MTWCVPIATASESSSVISVCECALVEATDYGVWALIKVECDDCKEAHVTQGTECISPKDVDAGSNPAVGAI